MDQGERRQRDAQREAVRDALPKRGETGLLRMASGEVLVYTEGITRRRPVALRAIVMPDGSTLDVRTNRFKRR